jgi:PAS domain S-box-containing protein
MIDSSGSLTGIHSVGRDISERKRVEAELARANQRFALAAKAAGVGFWEWDIASNRFTWDDEMFRLYGHDRVENLQALELWRKCLHPDDRARTEKELADAIDDSGTVFDTEFRIIDGQGVLRYLRGTAAIVRDADGRAIQMFGANIDTTERRRVEEELHQTIRRFSIAADAAEIGIWDWNLAANTLIWDDWMFRLYGRSRLYGEMPFEIWSDSVHPDDRPRVERALRATIAGKFSSYISEFRIRRPDGEIRHIKAAASVVRDVNGDALRMLGVTFDITERTLADMKMQSLVKELTRINGELESFTQVASHDLKSPLRGIDQLASWISEDLGENISEDTKGYLDLMQRRIERMRTLLDDLLAYSRAGRTEGEIVPVATRQLVEDVFDLAATRKPISLEASADLPVLQTYRAPLELVFRNLIGNAIKHHDKPEGRIVVTARRIDGAYEFAVIDDGPGIPPVHQQRVFGMFKTLKPRDEVEGSGIGLAIVKKTLESLGGSITLESDGEHGCTFRFVWPDTRVAATTSA